MERNINHIRNPYERSQIEKSGKFLRKFRIYPRSFRLVLAFLAIISRQSFIEKNLILLNGNSSNKISK